MRIMIMLGIAIILSYTALGASLEYTTNHIESHNPIVRNEYHQSSLSSLGSNNISSEETRIRNEERRWFLNNNYSNDSIHSDTTRLELSEKRYFLNNTNGTNSMISSNMLMMISNVTTNIERQELHDFYQKLISEIGIDDFKVYFSSDNNSSRNIVYYQDRPLMYPFEATTKTLNIIGNRSITISGVSIDGEVAAIRELRLKKDYYMIISNTQKVSSIETYDFLHNEENSPYFNTDTDEFREIIRKAVFGKFDEKNYTVKIEDNITLRIRNYDSLASEKIKDYKNITKMPVIFAGGLWSDIDCWKDLATKMSDEGYDTWMIEITGGPGQDCEECINYGFDDLTDSFWPSMIGAIQVMNNNSQVYYVGHSNGARTAISSLEKYSKTGKNNTGTIRIDNQIMNVSMTPHPVKKMVAAGVPGSFEGQGKIHELIKFRSEKLFTNLAQLNKTHHDILELSINSLIPKNNQKNNTKISFNLWNNYFSWINSSSDKQIGEDLLINNFLIIKGTAMINNDGIVTTQDEDEIFNNINSTEKMMKEIYALHVGMADNKKIQKFIIDFIK